MTIALASPPPAPKRTSLKPTAKLKAKAYQSVNPYDGKTLKTFEEFTDVQLETAIKTAATGFETWRNKSFAGRATIMAKAAALMRAHVDDFAKPVTLEMGKLIGESRGEVALSADILDYYAKNAERFLAPEKLQPALNQASLPGPYQVHGFGQRGTDRFHLFWPKATRTHDVARQYGPVVALRHCSVGYCFA